MPEPDLLGMLHHVALGTVADVAPLIGLNRAFVAKGLIAMRRRDHVGHTALMDVSRLNGPPEAWHLGFMLGPRINAGGRIGRADLGVRLLARRRRLGGGADRRRTRSAQQRAARHRAGGGSAGRSRGAGRARARRQGRRHRHGVRRLASRRRRPRRGAAEGKIFAAGLCDRAGARRHRHRLGPLDLRRRSRQGGAAGGARRPADEGRRPRDGRGRDAAQGEARGIPRLYGKRAGRTTSPSRATRTSCSSTARSRRAR